jgi:signal peptidase
MRSSIVRFMAVFGKIPKSVISLLRDVGLAFLIVLVIMLVLYAYSGIWPPMVVIESESMQHSDDTSYIGTIDTGDLVLVKKVTGKGDVVSYIEGRAIGYRTYGDYGDVVIYRRGGSYITTPIIHRAILWVEWNSTNNSFNAPDLALLEQGVDWDVSGSGSPYDITGNIILYGVGYENRTVTIRFSLLEQHSGFITMGDHNCAKWLDAYDRSIVHEDWIEGKGRGELPWFGLIKLAFGGDIRWNPDRGWFEGPQNSWNDLAIALTILIVTPILLDFVSGLLAKRKKLEEEIEESEEKVKDMVEGIEEIEESVEENQKEDDKYEKGEEDEGRENDGDDVSSE